MEYEYTEEGIKFNKVLNDFDKFTIHLTKLLGKLKLEYVLISGYVALLFGRTRMTEDIDLFLERISFEKFKQLWDELIPEYECLNINNAREAYEEYLLKGLAVNFSIKNQYSLRMEVKFPKTEADKWTLNNRKKVTLNEASVYISPLEMQIAYKLRLGRKGNEKDIEDAKHLYNLFKDELDKEVFDYFIEKFKIRYLFNKYLR